ncbi:hypothetical protein [Nostoc sp. DedSLP03]|uniref:hypothetical protein n=1 Tax=Nostoc sp. DedSLP03 TaxID=3075400 RepID=UPI002AD4FDFC|nr:hypothetical protein [Nostoc sp. DedSLP03]
MAIKDSFINPPITSDGLFSLIVNNLNTNDESEEKVFLTFFIEGEKQEVEKTNFLLPKKEDTSFTAYDKRIRSAINEQEYVLVIDSIKVNDFLWDWTYDFLQGLYKSLGYLSFGHFYSVFYGNYKVTPFGVHCHHVSKEAAFYFPIIGRKSMITWTPEFANKHPELKGVRDYQKFLDGSSLIEAEPGGLMYWPSDIWHVGDSRGGDVSIVIAINAADEFFRPLGYLICKEIQSLYGDSLKGNLLKRIIQALTGWYFILGSLNGIYEQRIQTLLAKHSNKYSKYIIKPIIKSFFWILSIIPFQKSKTKAFFNPDDLQESAEKIPEAIRSAAMIFKGIVDSLIIERVTTKLWLRMLTCYGMCPITASQFTLPKDEMLTVESCIQVYPKRVVIWRKVSENEVWVAINGLLIRVPWHPIFPLIIKEINTGKVQSVKKMLELSESTISRVDGNEYNIEDVLRFLETLLRYRGIKTVK